MCAAFATVDKYADAVLYSRLFEASRFQPPGERHHRYDNGRRSANRADHIVIDAVLTGDTMSGVNNRRTKP